MTHQSSSPGIESALDRIEQRLNESGTGEMGLLDTIHAVAAMVREARAALTPVEPLHKLPGHDETMHALDALKVRS